MVKVISPDPGTAFMSDGMTVAYPYTPMKDASQEIRLLTLTPTLDPQTIVDFSLQNDYISQKYDCYALSYISVRSGGENDSGAIDVTDIQ